MSGDEQIAPADPRRPDVQALPGRPPGGRPGIGAITCLDPRNAETKPMHTAEAARGRGIGQATLTHLLGAARTRRFRRASPETGTTAASAPARALYRSAGFTP